jgi:glycosyltransferase involved in cell wall biosynthesis
MSASLPRVVAILPRLSPSAWINIIKPLVALHEAGRIRAWVTLESLTKPRDIDRADVIVFSRNVNPDRAGLLCAAVARGVPVIYDLDDNFFEIPPDSAVGRACAQPRHLAMLREYLASASLIRVYSRPLLGRAAELNANVKLVSGAVDLAQVRTPPAMIRKMDLRVRLPKDATNSEVHPTDGRVKIVYATSRLDDPLAAIFLPALRRLMDEYAGRIEVHFWGPQPPRDLPGVRHHAVIHNYDRYLRRFSAAGFDIGLAPLVDDVFHRSKANTKFREYGACRIAGVYSDVDIYSDCVRHGETGLLVANSSDASYHAMRRLIDDIDLRRKIQRQARASVEANYSQQQFEKTLLAQIERLAGAARALVVPPSGEIASEDFRLKPILQAHSAHDGPPPPRMRRLPSLIPQAIGHLRRNGLARGWNTFRWLGSSGWSLARLQWRLRK